MRSASERCRLRSRMVKGTIPGSVMVCVRPRNPRAESEAQLPAPESLSNLPSPAGSM